jgi:hypothetical protein
MTLILTLVRPGEGVWQTVDYRLTKGGRVYDDWSPKQVKVLCPDGTLLLAFTGMAELGRLRIVDWIRETLRGNDRTMGKQFRHLVDRANRDIAGSQWRRNPFIVHGVGSWGVGAGDLRGGTPYVFSTSNVAADGSVLTNNPFPCRIKEIDDPRAFVAGSGLDGLQPEDTEMLYRAMERRPRRAQDYSGLLARINRNISARVPSVSPWCLSTYMPLDGGPFFSKAHVQRSDPIPAIDPDVPTIISGLDTTELFRITSATLKQVMAGEEVDEAALDAAVKAATTTGVEPR